jgi:threonine synthase
MIHATPGAAMVTHLECTKCSRRFEPGQVYTVCDECGAPLLARYDLARAALEMRPGHLELREPTMWRYRESAALPRRDPDLAR